MQTFLPYPNFTVSAMCLDNKRLGKQRVEARQIQSALQKGGGWENHPATKMWRGHTIALMLYGDCMIREWVRRGFNNVMPLMLDVTAQYVRSEAVMPQWLGDERFHSSHRAALLQKDPDWYTQFGWDETPEINYIWPGSAEEET